MAIKRQDELDATAGRKFADMNLLEKLAFIGKVCVFLVTGGFAFPNIFSE